MGRNASTCWQRLSGAEGDLIPLHSTALRSSPICRRHLSAEGRALWSGGRLTLSGVCGFGRTPPFSGVSTFSSESRAHDRAFPAKRVSHSAEPHKIPVSVSQGEVKAQTRGGGRAWGSVRRAQGELLAHGNSKPTRGEGHSENSTRAPGPQVLSTVNCGGLCVLVSYRARSPHVLVRKQCPLSMFNSALCDLSN